MSNYRKLEQCEVHISQNRGDFSLHTLDPDHNFQFGLILVRVTMLTAAL